MFEQLSIASWPPKYTAGGLSVSCTYSLSRVCSERLNWVVDHQQANYNVQINSSSATGTDEPNEGEEGTEQDVLLTVINYRQL